MGFSHSFGKFVRCLCSTPTEWARWGPRSGRFLSESKDSEEKPHGLITRRAALRALRALVRYADGEDSRWGAKPPSGCPRQGGAQKNETTPAIRAGL
jgi:hypothetical protein